MSPTSAKDEVHKHILWHQIKLLGLNWLLDNIMPGSSVVKDEGHMFLLHNWLKEEYLYGTFCL